MTVTLNQAEFAFGDFLLPWSLVIFSLGFLVAWAVIKVMERRGWTRGVWHLPLFFVALVILFSCLIGFVFAP